MSKFIKVTNRGYTSDARYGWLGDDGYIQTDAGSSISPDSEYYDYVLPDFEFNDTYGFVRCDGKLELVNENYEVCVFDEYRHDMTLNRVYLIDRSNGYENETWKEIVS